MAKSIRGASGPVNSSQDFERSPETSWPIAWSYARTAGSGRVGRDSDPAEKARKWPWPMSFRIASAMIERGELRLQRNRTLKVAGVTGRIR